MSNSTEDKVTQLVIKLLYGWSSKLNEDYLKDLDITIDQVNQSIEKLKRLINEDISKDEAYPTFIFEIRIDGTHHSPEPHKPFLCVYEFCVALEMFCKVKKMDIEKHWDRLLLKTSAHNTERFMWIHMNLINQPVVKLAWEQIVQRLMLKFDDPRRTQSVKRALESFCFDPNKGAETIESANRRFVAYVLETHCDASVAIPLYVNGMPDACKKLLRLTMAHDKHTGFNYCVKDIVQRSSIFIHAKQDEFIFYSKTARLAVALPMEKVNSKMCEFHISPAHTTVECSDYSILKYPYLDPLAVENDFSRLLTQENIKTPEKTAEVPKQVTEPTFIPSLPVANEIQVKKEPIEREARKTSCSYKQQYQTMTKRNNCIFCELPFYPGHLNSCKSLPRKKARND